MQEFWRESSPMEKLFVYGTLRTPCDTDAEDTRNYELVADEVISAQPATFDGADLLSFIHYPGIKPGEGTVVGELFDLTDAGLEICDGIEAHPDFFWRTVAPVSTETGEKIRAWIYWAPATMHVDGELIPSGDWFDRDRSRSDGRTPVEALAEDRQKHL